MGAAPGLTMRAFPACLFLALALPGPPGWAQPPASFPPPGAMPDLSQADPRGELPENGNMYCGPVAVSNSMMALFGEDLKWEGTTQHDVVRTLASVGYMNTHRRHGTHLNQFLRGVARFVEERGVEDFAVRFQGYLPHERRYGPPLQRPQLPWIRHHLATGGAAWLCVGWYTYDGETKEYTRNGSHWVTVAGYGMDEDGKEDPDILIVHDPAPSTGRRPQREYVRLVRLTEGTIVGAREDQKLRAAGIYRLAGGMHLHPDAEVALLDGVAGLLLRDRGGQAAPGPVGE